MHDPINDRPDGIAVIAAFTAKGQIRPIYFRASENGEEFTLKLVVCKEIQSKTAYDLHTIFECQYEHGNQLKSVKLKYHHTSHYWQLLRD